MLSFLLNEQIYSVVARQIRAKEPRLEILPLLTWRDGIYLGLPDELIVQAARAEQLTLVTYPMTQNR